MQSLEPLDRGGLFSRYVSCPVPPGPGPKPIIIPATNRETLNKIKVQRGLLLKPQPPTLVMVEYPTKCPCRTGGIPGKSQLSIYSEPPSMLSWGAWDNFPFPALPIRSHYCEPSQTDFRREGGISVLRGTPLRLNYLGSCKALGILGIKCFVGSTRHYYENAFSLTLFCLPSRSQGLLDTTGYLPLLCSEGWLFAY